MSARPRSLHRLVWPVFLVAALLLLGAGSELLYGIAVPVAALALGLFLCFAAGMVLGVVGPVVYSTRIRGRSLAELGFRRDNLGTSLALGVVLAAVQFGLTLWGYDLPQPVDWVPLLALALTVGAFEVVFFRGFVQTRLEAGFGSVAGVGGSALLYAAYHVGYGMGASEMLFLFGLGVVYSAAFALVRNVVVLWPLLVPLGSFYNNLQGGGITMPWAAILGFADVLALMIAALWLAAGHERRQGRKSLPGRRAARRDRRETPP